MSTEEIAGNRGKVDINLGSEDSVQIKVENKPESEDSIHLKMENQPETEDSVQLNEISKCEQKKTEEVLVRQGSSMFSIFGKKDNVHYPIIKRPFPRTQSNLLEKTKQSFGKLTNQHLHKNSVCKPNFSFLQYHCCMKLN